MTKDNMETYEIPENLMPRNDCLTYILENLEKEIKPTLLTKKAFNTLCRAESFNDGPYKDTFGEGYGEPYNPWRQAFGKTKKGLLIYCELDKTNDNKVNLLKRQRTSEFKTRFNKANLSAQEELEQNLTEKEFESDIKPEKDRFYFKFP
jgi:hypothetical protein